MTDSLLCPPENTAHLVLELPEDRLPEFSPMLQSGVFLKISHVGQSVRAFLRGPLALTDEYIRQHISTVFLDGMPVDDLDAVVLNNGARLALSSAMPGLVGATMRQGSPLASFRDTISCKATKACSGGEGCVCLKLFNAVMHDLGQHVFRKGVLVQAGVLRTFLKDHQDVLSDCSRIQFNGCLIAPDICLEKVACVNDAAIALTILPQQGSLRQRGVASHEKNLLVTGGGPGNPLAPF